MSRGGEHGTWRKLLRDGAGAQQQRLSFGVLAFRKVEFRQAVETGGLLRIIRGQVFFADFPGAQQQQRVLWPGYATTDLSAQKRLPLFGEGKNLLLRVEFFNLFNRSDFYNPITTLSTDGFTFNPEFGHILSAHDKRQMQFSARFDF